MNLRQIHEAGPVFERLIDHPSRFGKVVHFIWTNQLGFDGLHGPCFIDENFASIRGPCRAIGLHSGGQDRVTRCQFRYHDGWFHCGQINILMAFNDIGEGDGATMVIPANHKTNIRHPQFDEAALSTVATLVDGLDGAAEVHLRVGDALPFVDAITHGSAEWTSPGQRRIAVYRYGLS